jgi:hypothetical protein
VLSARGGNIGFHAGRPITDEVFTEVAARSK